MKLWQAKGWACGWSHGLASPLSVPEELCPGVTWPEGLEDRSIPSWSCPSFWAAGFAMLGATGARRKTKENYPSHEIYLTLTLAFFQKGTFGGQFHSKLCCLCSSTRWLAMKHQAAKQSRHTACQAASQGNAWAAWPQSHARVQSSCIPEQDSVHTPTERRDFPLCVVGVWHTRSTAFAKGKEIICKTVEEVDSDGKFPFLSKCQWTSMTSCAYKIFCLLETNPRS